jgi:DNA-binding GntR family transcriptional regulator
MYTRVSRACVRNVNSDIAYEYIRKQILSGEYVPGSALMTISLAKEMGISRTPVRDALRQLEADGLVSIRPRLGATVKKMSMREFRESCELRLALEGHAAALAARNRTATDLQEIKFALEEMRRLTDKVNAAQMDKSLGGELTRADVGFHIAIITAAKNELIKKELLKLHLINRIVATTPFPGSKQAGSDKKGKDRRRKAIMASHDEIYDAIARSAADEAKRAMERHVQEIIDNTVHLMARAESSLITRDLTEEEQAYSS